MKNLKTIAIAVLIIILAVFSILFFLSRSGKLDNLAGIKKSGDKDINAGEETGGEGGSDADKESGSSGTSIIGTGGGESEGGGEEGGGQTDTETNEQIELPDDLDERECGFYFFQYGVCAGTCKSGTCTSEGRSCYCKS